jgi:hypothetical protein
MAASGVHATNTAKWPLVDRIWNYFWGGKLRNVSRQGVAVFSRALRYRNKIVKLPDGSTHAFLTAEEKGIDVRTAIDVIRLCPDDFVELFSRNTHRRAVVSVEGADRRTIWVLQEPVGRNNVAS